MCVGRSNGWRAQLSGVLLLGAITIIAHGLTGIIAASSIVTQLFNGFEGNYSNGKTHYFGDTCIYTHIFMYAWIND